MPRAVIDSGATQHFVEEGYDGGAYQPTDNGIAVQVADKRVVTTTGTNLLPYKELPLGTRVCHNLPRLSTPLLSVEKFCDANLVVLFDDTNIYLCDRKKIDLPALLCDHLIMQEYQDPHSNLYLVPLHKDHKVVQRVHRDVVQRVTTQSARSA